jgi:hypothetical protein
VLVIGPRITGPEQALAELANLGYVATTRTVTARCDMAVVVGDHAVNVSFRTPDGAWRLVATIGAAGNAMRLNLTGLMRRCIERPAVELLAGGGNTAQKGRSALQSRSDGPLPVVIFRPEGHGGQRSCEGASDSDGYGG